MHNNNKRYVCYDQIAKTVLHMYVHTPKVKLYLLVQRVLHKEVCFVQYEVIILHNTFVVNL